ncbi:MAG: D-2-hydroxyacid dehydrogenase, partial [Chitinivibrionales bacterium]|nr:D-2-hydroxyacid dehydrogenase [Chitinivibrionales bacterium]MBD3356521.1 D-2-hydroxyacid dehydrogenase [Chitinivibrionales bacterium]
TPPDPSGRVRTFYGAFHGYLIAESLLGAILYFNHRLDIMVDRQRRKTWDRAAQAHTRLLRGRRVLLLGYGAIGRHCARVLKPFDVTIYGLQRKHKSGTDPETGVEYVTISRLDELLGRVEHVAAMLPGGAETNNLLTRKRFGAMKPGAYFYNVGRGNCYAEEDLVWALDTGILGGAALDVFAREPLPADSPLWERGNVMITPHSTCIYQDYLYLYYDELRETLGNLFAQTGRERS